MLTAHRQRQSRGSRDANRQLQCPLGLLWSAYDDMKRIYGDLAEPWAAWSSHIVMKQRIMSGHHMVEEAPNGVADYLETFFMNKR